MSGEREQAPFFVGYLPLPRTLRPFLALVGGALLVAAAILGYWVAATMPDPGPARFRFDMGRQTVTGVLAEGAYPVLRVTEGNDAIPAGHTLMLSGGGKTGVQERAAPHLGGLVTVSGVLLQRGPLDMLQVRGAADGLQPVEGEAPVLEAAEPLGRWRLTGELCDGKCYAGAMRPGRGLSHKACANLCVIGGVPMVFVATAPIPGAGPNADFLLVTGPEGGAVPQRLLDMSSMPVTLEGAVDRLGDLLVLRADPESLRAAGAAE
ncbi:MAG: hypothetical protein AAF968_07070 [Pseudomonadota bacterium]